MYKNYFYLFRCVKDLLPLIQNEKIVEIYTQEKDKLFISIPKKNIDNFHLILSTNPQLPYVTNKEEHHKAKKNTKNFFEKYLPDEIKNIELAFSDRIIKLSLTNSCLYFFIRGSKTNIVLIGSNGVILSFKKISLVEQKLLKDELSNTKFISSIDELIENFAQYSKNELIKKYRFIDKDIIREVDSRIDDWTQNLMIVIQEIINRKISVFESHYSQKPIYCPTTFKYSEIKNENYTYDSYFNAVNKYLSLFYSIGKDKSLRGELEKYLIKELEKVSNKLNDINTRIEEGSKEDFYFSQANLLLTNIHLLSKGMKEIELEDYNNKRNVRIDLDNKLTPNQNIAKLFEKAKSERQNYKKSEELFKSLNALYEKLINTKSKLEKTKNLDELRLLKKELHIKTSMKKNIGVEKYNFRHFLIDGKYHLYIGKDSKNNDLLTTKFAKQNDYWFHARGASGSHVVLRVENTKEALPKNILKKAASIAAFYSKAKTSKLAPVCYTFKKYVVKKKGLNPGQVLLLKEEVLLVQPGIPAGCEMISND